MLNELVKRIAEEGGLTGEEVMAKIEEKREELSGLISEEGAAYIVAKELGIAIVRQEKLNIANIIPGMQNVDVVGKITKISPVREFATEKAKGKVANITIADETGSVRISFWNDEINSLAGFEINDIVRVRGYVKQDNLGNAEIRLGRYGAIAKSDEEIGAVKQTERKVERSNIGDLGDGQTKEIRAPLLQVFEGNIFYEVCPTCRARVKLNENDNFKCEEHGEIENPDYGLILSGIADDGSGSIRVVFFNENAERLIGISAKDAKKLFDRKKKLDAITSLVPIGKEFVLGGRARRNALFDRLEFIINNVNEVDIKKEIDLLMNNLGEQ